MEWIIGVAFICTVLLVVYFAGYFQGKEDQQDCKWLDQKLDYVRRKQEIDNKPLTYENYPKSSYEVL